MRIEELMTHPVQVCRPDDTLEHAAQLMWEHDCGCLPVVTGDGALRATSMITDRDICMSAFFQQKPLRELRVSDAMAKRLYACHAHNRPVEAERIMREARVRRLPVVDEEGALVGLISLADIAREAAREIAAGKREITETEVGGTLAAICEPEGRRLAA